MGRRICCCGADIWTRVIAWLHIISSVLILIELINVLVDLTQFTINEENKKHTLNSLPPNADLEDLEHASATQTGLVLSYIIVIIMIAVYAAGVPFGILLLKGSYKRIPQYLRYWIIYAAAITIVALISVVMNGIGGDGHSALGMMIAAGFTILINGFCIWVVQIHLREMEMDFQLQSI